MMVNYSMTRWPLSSDTNKYASVHEALTALHTQIETVDNAKTIRAMGVLSVNGGAYFVPYLVYDT
jgi:hypothetical protein